MDAADRENWEKFTVQADHRAFAALVERHLPLVHAVALRVTRNPSLAEEVSQIVFSKLAHTRPAISENLPLAAWLHRTARWQAIGVVRSEIRRQQREKIAATASPMKETTNWEELAPVLDDAIDQLPARDRVLILTRYFEGKSHADIGQLLSISADAARVGVSRALEKLRVLLAKRGVTTTASALAVSLPAHAAPGVPASLAALISTTALAGTSAVSMPLATLGIFTMTTKAIIISSCGITLAALGIWAVVSSQDHGTHFQAAAPSARPVPPSQASSAAQEGPESQPPPPPQISNQSGGTEPVGLTSAQKKQIEETFRKQWRETNARRMNERVGILTERLGLSPDQASKIKEIMEAGLSEREEAFNLFAGEAVGGMSEYMLPENVLRISDQVKMDEKTAEILTPEQKPEFEIFRKEQKENQIEISASREMLEIQENLTLTPEQKDNIYQQLTQILTEEYGQDANEGNPYLPMHDASQKLRRQAALSSILTPEQMKNYTNPSEGIPLEIDFSTE